MRFFLLLTLSIFFTNSQASIPKYIPGDGLNPSSICFLNSMKTNTTYTFVEVDNDKTVKIVRGVPPHAYKCTSTNKLPINKLFEIGSSSGRFKGRFNSVGESLQHIDAKPYFVMSGIYTFSMIPTIKATTGIQTFDNFIKYPTIDHDIGVNYIMHSREDLKSEIGIGGIKTPKNVIIQSLTLTTEVPSSGDNYKIFSNGIHEAPIYIQVEANMSLTSSQLDKSIVLYNEDTGKILNLNGHGGNSYSAEDNGFNIKIPSNANIHKYIYNKDIPIDKDSPKFHRLGSRGIPIKSNTEMYVTSCKPQILDICGRLTQYDGTVIDTCPDHRANAPVTLEVIPEKTYSSSDVSLKTINIFSSDGSIYGMGSIERELFFNTSIQKVYPLKNISYTLTDFNRANNPPEFQCEGAYSPYNPHSLITCMGYHGHGRQAQSMFAPVYLKNNPKRYMHMEIHTPIRGYVLSVYLLKKYVAYMLGADQTYESQPFSWYSIAQTINYTMQDLYGNSYAGQLKNIYWRP